MTGGQEDRFARIQWGLFADGKHEKKMGAAIWLYLYLVYAVDYETGKCFRKLETIARDTKSPASTVKRRMKVLRDEGYIKTIRHQHNLEIQITKWRARARNFRRTRFGPSESPEKIQIDQIGYPDSQGLGYLKSKSENVNSRKIKEKSARETKSGPSIRDISEIKNKECPNPEKTDSGFSQKKGKSNPPGKRKPSKPANPDIKKAVDHFHNEFLRIHGFKPKVGGQHAKIFQAELEGEARSLEKLKSLVTGFLELDDPFLKENAWGIQFFQGKINPLLMAAKKEEPEDKKAKEEIEELFKELQASRARENPNRKKLEMEAGVS